MANELMATKEKIASYVHDATDIEKQIFTLEQAADGMEIMCKKKKTEALESQNTDPHDCVPYPMGGIIEVKEFEIKPCSFVEYAGFWKLVGGVIIAFITCFIIGLILSVLGEAPIFDYTRESLLIITIASVIISILCTIIPENKKYQEYLSNTFKHNQDLCRRVAEVERNNTRFAEEMEKYEKALVDKRQELNREAEKLEREAQFYAAQADETRKSIKPLYEQRDKFYSVGIIPPDYRTIDCVYAFDQIFRNDLADNMREAVKIYEERVFRGEIIRGVRSLGQLMGNVSSLLTRLQADMSTVKNEIGSMNKDVVRIYEQNQKQNDAMLDEARHNYAEIEKRNRELFKETQMSRCALESLKENNDKLMKYIEE